MKKYISESAVEDVKEAIRLARGMHAMYDDGTRPPTIAEIAAMILDRDSALQAGMTSPSARVAVNSGSASSK